MRVLESNEDGAAADRGVGADPSSSPRPRQHAPMCASTVIASYPCALLVPALNCTPSPPVHTCGSGGALW